MAHSVATLVTAAVVQPPPAWRSLQVVPPELANRGKLTGTPPSLALEKVGDRYGKKAAWRLGTLTHDELRLDIHLSLDRNPVEPCCMLSFVDQGSATRIGRVLLACGEQESALRGMEIDRAWSGNGLTKLFLACWLRYCLDAGLTPRTRTINKPLLSLSLQRFGFHPIDNSGVTVRIGGTGGVEARSALIRTSFALPDERTLETAVDGILSGGTTRLRLAASPVALRRALTLRGGVAQGSACRSGAAAGMLWSREAALTALNHPTSIHLGDGTLQSSVHSAALQPCSYRQGAARVCAACKCERGEGGGRGKGW